MESSIRYSNAMAEVLHYLKGIRQEDIDKIPKKLIEFFKDNSSKDYECKFDYNKPLKELKLQEETKGLIAMICLNYWCETEEQKKNFIAKLNENEKKYQEELREKYNPDNIFKKQEINKEEIQQPAKSQAIIVYKKPLYKKILDNIKNIFRLK